jgi:hypothetical protein
MLKKIALSLVCLSGLAFADVRFASPAQVGSAKLEPGLYSVKVQGSIVIFSDVNKGKSTTAMAKMEKMDKKAESNSVQGSVVDGVQQVQFITLQGSDQKIVFAQ